MEIWQLHLKTALSTAAQLYDYLGIHAIADHNDAGFAIRVPRPFADRMQRGDRDDPLLRQVISRPEELQHVDGFTVDPIGEAAVNPIPGLLHKYHGRVLIVLTGSCAVNCRYCFRRHFAYQDNSALSHWDAICDYIKKDHTIREVIFSGGEPLLVDDTQLGDLIQDVEGIAHVTTLRIHTRLPVVIPQRITDSLLTVLAQSRLAVVTVLHINHAHEIDDFLQAQLKKLRAVTHLLNQTVLLKEINDCCDALAQLSYRLFESDVMPYYLHQLDPIKGAHHFYVKPEVGMALIQQLKGQLPGYLVPRYVQEIAAANSKVDLRISK